MTFEDEFLNYALQTKFLLAALRMHVEQLPDLKMLLKSYETSLLANYKIYADPSRQRGMTRDVIRDGVLALKDHPASFLNVIALTPDHLFNMRLTRNGKALDADALNYRYPLVDMLSGQVNNFKIYNEIIAGVELMQGVDITVLNRGAKGLQTNANKAIFSFDGDSAVEVKTRVELPDQTMGNCVTVNTAFGLVDVLTEAGIDLALAEHVGYSSEDEQRLLLEKNNEALANCVLAALPNSGLISRSVQQEILRTDSVYLQSMRIIDGVSLPVAATLNNYRLSIYPLIASHVYFPYWPKEAQDLVCFAGRMGQQLNAKVLDVDDPRIEELIGLLPSYNFALGELALCVANYVADNVKRLSLVDDRGHKDLEVLGRAIVLQEKAYRLSPINGRIVNYLGVLYEKYRRLNLAKKYMLKASQLDPNNTFFAKDLARVQRAELNSMGVFLVNQV